MNLKKAISAVDRAGALLVFPMDNRKQPASLWSAFFPRTPMRWEWDESGDDRVSKLWHLRAELSTTRKVVYTKWFQGRATYLSRPLFAAMLRALNPNDTFLSVDLSSTAERILDILEAESPVSTKEVKRMADLVGRANEALYHRSLKELWSRLLIVAFGEVDDGAFPSLAIGSTRVLFEDLWREAFALKQEEAEGRVAELLGADNLFFGYFLKLKAASGPRKNGRSGKKRIPGVVRFEEL